ncbi:MAG: hypothetical protein C0609_10665 [Deltaproteobacteria bacterium]|nr:MAG: hypothetical protein C0609_10665 [Deltaproteobacteria bacterium]
MKDIEELSKMVAKLLSEAIKSKTSAKHAELPPPGSTFTWNFADGFREVTRPSLIDPTILTGIDNQKSRFYFNIERFLSGAPSHDVLLWWERGSGKSSLVRSLPLVFTEQKMALVSVTEEQIPNFPRLMEALVGDERRWVVYLDDLSFESPGGHYRELKSILEGGVEERPENTVMVVTSNRRHLTVETFADEREIHPGESVAELVSLADRFGLSLGFYTFDESTYLEAVKKHLDTLGLSRKAGKWQPEAIRWAMARGIRSGRTAKQFAVEWSGVVGAKGNQPR